MRHPRVWFQQNIILYRCLQRIPVNRVEKNNPMNVVKKKMTRHQKWCTTIQQFVKLTFPNGLLGGRFTDVSASGISRLEHKSSFYTMKTIRADRLYVIIIIVARTRTVCIYNNNIKPSSHCLFSENQSLQSILFLSVL